MFNQLGIKPMILNKKIKSFVFKFFYIIDLFISVFHGTFVCFSMLPNERNAFLSWTRSYEKTRSKASTCWQS